MQRKPRILIAEDEAAIRTGLVDVFVYHGYDVDAAEDGLIAERMASTGRYDLVLLDVMMPGRDGFAVLAHLRAQDREQAVILLTAKSADEDVIQGLALGADDYVSKPFSIAQLVLRVQAVLRRTLGAPSDDAELKLAEDVRIDCANLCGVCRGEEMPFTRREIEVLRYLAAHSERPVPREELLHKVWGYARDLGIETRTVDIHIAKLRRKIEADPKQPQFILTVRGGGYRLQRGAA
ncbi:MAG: response regulator transcription factor [Xanthomonadales bacterium]|nr:response regulator transcription factor [Xanthomonadales bacterium]